MVWELSSLLEGIIGRVEGGYSVLIDVHDAGAEWIDDPGGKARVFCHREVLDSRRCKPKTDSELSA